MKEDLLAETIDRTAEMTAHIVTRCLLRSFTLEEAIEAVEEAAHHVSEAGADEVEERIENKDPMARYSDSLIASRTRRRQTHDTTGGDIAMRVLLVVALVAVLYAALVLFGIALT